MSDDQGKRSNDGKDLDLDKEGWEEQKRKVDLMEKQQEEERKEKADSVEKEVEEKGKEKADETKNGRS